MTTKYYVELPADEYGNRYMTNAIPSVIGIENPFVDEKEMLRGELIGPKELVNKFGPQFAGFASEWLEVEGPARVITNREQDDLCQEALL